MSKTCIVLLLLKLCCAVFMQPPGTAESQALMFSVADCGDTSGSPCTAAMDMQDQLLLPALGITSFDCFNQPPPAFTEEAQCKNQESMKDARSLGACSNSSASTTGEFDHLSKAEAMMTFAPEYTPVETPVTEPFSSIFRSPYFPKARNIELSHSCSNSYVYGATPPTSYLEVSNEKIDLSSKVKAGSAKSDAGSHLQSKRYYTHVQSSKQKLDKGLIDNNNGTTLCKGDVLSSVSGVHSSDAAITLQMKKTENPFEAGHFSLSFKTVLATEIECIMFQAAMCRIRHTLLSCSKLVPNALNRSTGCMVLDQFPSEICTMTEKNSSKYETKKSIPVRIAGDIDGRVRDGPLNAPVGVWRSVGAPKGAKSPSTPSMDNAPSLPLNIFSEEGIMTSGQGQPLQELLDAMAFLVQQSASFVDVSLDTDHDDPYGWLALQEQQRRGFSCCPSMVHAGCGGLLAACHSLDIAGIELIDPLSADVSY